MWVADLFGQCLGQGVRRFEVGKFVVLIFGLLFRILFLPCLLSSEPWEVGDVNAHSWGLISVAPLTIKVVYLRVRGGHQSLNLAFFISSNSSTTKGERTFHFATRNWSLSICQRKSPDPTDSQLRSFCFSVPSLQSSASRFRHSWHGWNHSLCWGLSCALQDV